MIDNIMHLSLKYVRLLLLIALAGNFTVNYAQVDQRKLLQVDEYLDEVFDKSDIPGASIAIVTGKDVVFLNRGYQNGNTLVSENTIFQIGSCTKAFTGLLVSLLEKDGKIVLDSSVNYYLPWINFRNSGAKERVKVKHLLFHTSGIPQSTIAKIPTSNEDQSLQKTIEAIKDQELSSKPGERYEYATINYDVLALITEKVTNIRFEVNMQILLNQLGLANTTIGVPRDSSYLSAGHKISFFRPRIYHAPVFKGNNAAGYIFSTAGDIGRWLQIQMDEADVLEAFTISTTHDRDETVPLHSMAAYARGWNVLLNGSNYISHSGMNPNYSTYVGFKSDEKIGVAILANSNSEFTTGIGENILNIMVGRVIDPLSQSTSSFDRPFSVVLVILLIYIGIVIGYLFLCLFHWFKGKRSFNIPKKRTVLLYLSKFLLLLPFGVGAYFLPDAMAGFSWNTIVVWAPDTFLYSILALGCAAGITYVSGFVLLFFPHQDQMYHELPIVIIISVVSGLSNMILIVLITSSIGHNGDIRYILGYYLLVMVTYLAGRRFVQTRLTHISKGLVFKLRVQIIDRILAAPFQRFESIDKGRIYTVINDDVAVIGNSSNAFVVTMTSVFTVLGAFIYLATVAFWSTIVTVAIFLLLATIYYLIGKGTKKYWDQARDSRDVFINLINSLIQGFKELSVRADKKNEFKDCVTASAKQFKDTTTTAEIKFANSFLVGDAFLVILLGLVTFLIPRVFPSIDNGVIMSFVVILIYLINPLTTVLNSIPTFIQVRIAWGRISQFMEDLPLISPRSSPHISNTTKVNTLQLKDLSFRYKNNNDASFEIGPINLSVSCGEIVFITGGNGSGKTTFAKLLTGLYNPSAGKLFINEKEVEGDEIGKYLSVIFNPPFIFDKLYGTIPEVAQAVGTPLLKKLQLDSKVFINEEGCFSTTRLSTGQLKRMALAQCLIEDSSIFVFDEWAADQDPGFKNFFYTTILPQLKQSGKIIIAITHDDKYFFVADRVYKMNGGILSSREDVAFISQ